MHELFLTSLVTQDDLPRTLKILQGLCAMHPTPLLRRRLFYARPAQVPPCALDAAFLAAQPAPKAPAWKELSDQVKIQSYLLMLMYDVKPGDLGNDK